MILTEKAARKKKCVALGGKCAASGCMGWRWTATGLSGPAEPQESPRRIATMFGYCGLAGIPQEDAPNVG